MIPGVMNDFFLQPGPDLLRARVWVDDQRLEFEWNPEDRRWNAMDTNGDHVYLDTQMMSEIISEHKQCVTRNKADSPRFPSTP